MPQTIVLAVSSIIVVMLLWVSVTMLVQMLFFVPFIPTPQSVVATMLDLADLRSTDRVVELGAGDARLMIAAARRVPGISVTGYEIARPVWLLGRLRLFLSGVHASFLCRDFHHAQVADVTVVFCYLSPRAMADLKADMLPKLKPGTRIVSHAFPLPGLAARETAIVPLGRRRRARVFLYVTT